MEQTIIDLSGLEAAEIAALATLGVNNGADLSFITFEDLTDILGATSIVKLRKLSLIGSYVMWGQVIDVTTMMPMITSYLNTPVQQNNNPVPPVPNVLPPDPTRGALRMHVNSIEKYTGSPIDFEDWELKTKAN